MSTDAIVLSRDDAFHINYMIMSGRYQGQPDQRLSAGSEGYSWLNAVPDEVLDDLADLYRDGIFTSHVDRYPTVKAERERRAKLCQVKK